MKLFLDSGAFSVWNKGQTIDIDNYIEFCLKYQSDLDLIASLDVIPGRPNVKLKPEDSEIAAKQGFKNYEKMLQAGIKTEKLLHTFHQGDNPKWLEKLLKEGGPYIAISPANDKTSAQRAEWMDSVVLPILLDSKGQPKAKFHGFAVTSLKLILDYPWTSVDSSSWRLRGSGYGLLDLPQLPGSLKTKEDYYIQSIPIGTGIKKHASQEKQDGFFPELKTVSQKEASFLRNPQFRKDVEKLLEKYHFTFEELEESHHLRAAWNAIYLLTTVKKFSDTVVYLATNELTALKTLRRKMKQNDLPTKDLAILTSFIALQRKTKTDALNNLDRLIKIKNVLE